MTYLYALMGIAMLTGIMSMLEVSNSIIGLGIYSLPPEDPYIGSSYQLSDRLFLKSLSKANSSWPKGKEFCQELQKQVGNDGAPIIASKYKIEGRSNSRNTRFINTCSLINKEHRVIISYGSSTNNNYSLYSCIVDDNYYCNFEENYEDGY